MVITRLHLKQWDFNIKYYKAALLLGSYVFKGKYETREMFSSINKTVESFFAFPTLMN